MQEGEDIKRIEEDLRKAMIDEGFEFPVMEEEEETFDATNIFPGIVIHFD